MAWSPAESRYSTMKYNRCGRSGLLLPAISLGLWHNFGGVDSFENQRAMVRRAFDLGITHFDLANNYGPPPGSAEENFGAIFRKDLAAHRDELIISTKAGYRMWPGPYGEWGSRKYLLASLDQSLRRMGLEYVDIFYSHRPDPNTPLEETMGALDAAVRRGKALYAGISSYSAEQTAEAARILRALGTPCLIHQPNYSMFSRWIEEGLAGSPPARRDRLHRVLPAGAGAADGPIPRRHPGRFPRRQAQRVPEAEGDHEGKAGEGPQAQQPGQGARAEPGADGACVGLARGQSHLRPRSAPARSARSRRTSPRSRTSNSPPRNCNRLIASWRRARMRKGTGPWPMRHLLS